MKAEVAPAADVEVYPETMMLTSKAPPAVAPAAAAAAAAAPAIATTRKEVEASLLAARALLDLPASKKKPRPQPPAEKACRPQPPAPVMAEVWAQARAKPAAPVKPEEEADVQAEVKVKPRKAEAKADTPRELAAVSKYLSLCAPPARKALVAPSRARCEKNEDEFPAASDADDSVEAMEAQLAQYKRKAAMASLKVQVAKSKAAHLSSGGSQEAFATKEWLKWEETLLESVERSMKAGASEPSRPLQDEGKLRKGSGVIRQRPGNANGPRNGGRGGTGVTASYYREKGKAGKEKRMTAFLKEFPDVQAWAIAQEALDAPPQARDASPQWSSNEWWSKHQ